jgi:hypothetical protein
MPSLYISDFFQQSSPYQTLASFDGKNYLVLWKNFPNLLGKRVNQSGVIIDKEPIVVTDPSYTIGYSDIVFNGANYFIVFDHISNETYTIRAARITPSGEVLDPKGVPITESKPPNTIFHSQVAHDGTNHLVTWLCSVNGSGNAIKGLRVDNNCKAIDLQPITIAKGDGETVALGFQNVCFDGTNYLVTWTTSSNDTVRPSLLHTIRVSPSGKLLSPEKTFPSPDVNGFYAIELAPDGTGTRVVWSSGQGKSLYTVKIAKSGEIADSTRYFTSSRSGAQLSVASNQKNSLVAYENVFLTTSNIYVKFIPGSASLARTDSIIVPTQINYQKLPSAAFDGKNYLVTWQDINSITGFDIKGKRLDMSGNLIDQTSIPVAVSTAAEQNPRIVHGSKEYFALWSEPTTATPVASIVSGKRIRYDGSVIDPPLQILQIKQRMQYDLDFNGDNYIVAWTNNDIYALRINQSCILVDSTPVAFHGSNPPPHNPFLACAKTNFMALWFTSDFTYPPNGTRIAGKRASNEGVLLDTKEIFPVSAAYLNIISHAIVFGGTNYFVVWKQNFVPGGEAIYGKRISEQGVVLDAQPIFIKSSPGIKLCDVLFDGTCYRVLSMIKPDSASYFIITQVSSSGNVEHEDSITIQSKIVENPVMALGSNSRCLIVFSGYTDSINSRAANTMRIKGMIYTPQNVEIQKEKSVAANENYTITVCHSISKKSILLLIKPLYSKIQTNREKIIRVKLFNVTGRLIKSYKETTKENQSVYMVNLSGNNGSHISIPAGIYFVQINIGTFSQTRKISLF